MMASPILIMSEITTSGKDNFHYSYVTASAVLTKK